MDGDGTAPPAHAARKPFRWRFPRRRLRDDPDLTLGWLSALSGDHAAQHAAVVSRNPGGLSRVVSAGSIRRPRRGATIASARPSRHARRRSGHCVTCEPSEHALGYGSRSVRTVPLVRSTALNLRFFVPRSRLSVMLTARRRLSSRSSAVFPSGAAIEQADSEIPEPPRSFRRATAARRRRHPGESRDRSPRRARRRRAVAAGDDARPGPVDRFGARIEERATNDGRGPPASGRRE